MPPRSKDTLKTSISFEQTPETVRGEAVSRSSWLPNEAAALYSQGDPAGHSCGPVDRNSATQSVVVGGTLLEASRTERQRHKDSPGGTGPLEDRTPDLDQSGPLPFENLVQVAGILEQIGPKCEEHPGS